MLLTEISSSNFLKSQNAIIIQTNSYCYLAVPSVKNEHKARWIQIIEIIN